MLPVVEIAPDNFDLVAQIADRVERKRNQDDHEFDRMRLMIDIISAVEADPKINLKTLLSFPDGSFFHDVAGIQKHIDRETGKMTDCFVPRCTREVEMTTCKTCSEEMPKGGQYGTCCSASCWRQAYVY